MSECAAAVSTRACCSAALHVAALLVPAHLLIIVAFYHSMALQLGNLSTEGKALRKSYVEVILGSLPHPDCKIVFRLFVVGI